MLGKAARVERKGQSQQVSNMAQSFPLDGDGIEASLKQTEVDMHAPTSRARLGCNILPYD